LGVKATDEAAPLLNPFSWPKWYDVPVIQLMQFASFRHNFRQSSAENAQVVHSYRYLIAILDDSGMLGARVT
jgi:hypothetical protein